MKNTVTLKLLLLFLVLNFLDFIKPPLASALEADETDRVLFLCFHPQIRVAISKITPELKKEQRFAILGPLCPESDGALEEIFANHIRVDDEKSSEVEVYMLKIIQTHGIKRIASYLENDVLRTARIRDILKLSGQNYDSALIFRDKVHMKDYVRERGFITPRYKRSSSWLDLYDFAQQVGGHIIVKPCRGTGSTRTYVLENNENVMEFAKDSAFSHLHESPLIVEEFVAGDMYHIDGIIVDGSIYHIWPSKYINTCLSILNEKAFGNYIMPANNPLTTLLIEYTKRLIQALPTPDGAFHCEVFIKSDNSIVFCEIACRPGGAKVPESVEAAFGYNIQTEHMRVLCGLAPLIVKETIPIAPKILSMGIGLPSKPKHRLVKFDVQSLKDNFPNIREVKQKLSCGSIANPKSQIDTLASFRLEANTEEEILKLFYSIEDIAKILTVWESVL